MQNPILNSRKIFVVYIAIWIGLSAGQVAVMYSFYDFPLYISHVDTLVYNGLFAAIMLGLWYTIKYLSLDNRSIFMLILDHAITEILVIGVWLFLSSSISNMLIGGAEYESFVNNSYPWRLALGGMYYLIIVLYYYLSIYYNSYKEKQLNEAQLQTLVKETELNLLRSQLNPHFIFNSLNSISSLTVIEPYKAQEMVVKLSTYMRYALKKEEEQKISLGSELEYSMLYLDIEKVRFGDKLLFNMKVESEAMQVKIPSMLLQPLLENAIKHGVYESTEAVQIDFKAEVIEGHLHMEILNNFDASL
ncbi:MAG TPA: histidine kinase, partial [Cytophagales bacterium]|nr:histidine kinase [Cytophagales bacterium]